MNDPTLTGRARLALPALLLVIYSTLSVARRVTEVVREANLLRASVSLAFAGAVATGLLLVFRDPGRRTGRVVAALALVLAAYAAVVWPMQSPEEKLHFLEYGAVAVLAFWAGPVSLSERQRLGFAALFALAAGWVDEGIQALLPNRYYDLRDVGFNALAGVMALASLALLRAAQRAHAHREAGTAR
jgi:hypothetical protein